MTRKNTYFLLLGLGLALFALSVFFRSSDSDRARIMILGDSIVVGYTSDGEWSEPFQFGFRGPLLQMLGASGCRVSFVGGSQEPWKSDFIVEPSIDASIDLRLSNQDGHRGYGGSSVVDLALRLPLWLLSDRPDIVVIYAGINNLELEGEKISRSAKYSLWSMVFISKLLRPNSSILISKIAPNALNSTPAATLNRYIESYIPRRSVTFVDHFRLFVSEDSHPKKFLFSNNLNHPTNHAYRMMAEEWYKSMLPILERENYCESRSSSGITQE